MIEVVRATRMNVPNKHVKVVIPFGRSSVDLAKQCHSKAKIKLTHLANNQFSDIIELSTGNQIEKTVTWI
ncbi:MAG: hypothetical protein IJU40_07010 [Desulfovibrionaceae bacterium]|nr:hypothetical protein [Desulfovibrionaceae bacterium]